MNTSKLVDPYSISTNILKLYVLIVCLNIYLSCSVLSKPLITLIIFSFSEGTFPDLLKFASMSFQPSRKETI